MAMEKAGKGWAMIGAAALLAPSPTFAQDTAAPADVGTSTPPELRDFRLDSPPPRPAPEPRPSQSEPEAAPLPVTSEAPPRNTATRQQARPPVQGTTARPEAPPTAPPPNIATDAAPSPDDVAATPAAPAIPAAKVASGEAREAQPAIKAGAWRDWLSWIGAALALLAALAAAYFVRRRKRARAGDGFAAPEQQPSPPARLDNRKPERAAPQRPAVDPTASEPPVTTPVVAEFKPESAQLSIASLAVTGTLAVHNRSNAPVTDLCMRSHMISAQVGQHQAIAAFHAEKGAGSVQSLVTLGVGERIDAVIEIRLPRSELAAFRWTDREFVAPILLINLSGHSGATDVEVRLSQLIGRAGSDASARMKPLAVDRGPKRFTGISARPLFA